MGFLIPLLFVAVFAVILVVGLKQAEARRKELAALATRRGWTFQADDDRGYPERMSAFDCFDRGSSKRSFNTLEGQVESPRGPLRIRTGDYRYSTGSGKNRRTHRLSYLVVGLPWAVSANLGLLIRPEHFGDSITAFVGFDDIDFESEEFSRRFFVQSNDRKFAYAVVHARMMEYLLASPDRHLQLRGSELVVRGSPQGIWTPEEMEAAVDWCRGFAGHWPDYLVSDCQQTS